jgi:hypothetical protein
LGELEELGKFLHIRKIEQDRTGGTGRKDEAQAYQHFAKKLHRDYLEEHTMDQTAI